MISVVELYNTTVQRMKSGTSGYTTQEEWNNILRSVEKELPEYLYDFYEINSKVQDALSFLVKPSTETVTSTGLTKPTDYLHFLGAEINGYPVYPSKKGARGITENMVIRKSSSVNNRYYYYMEDNKIKFLPANETEVTYTYLREPVYGSIVLTVDDEEDDDYIMPEAGTDLEWPSTMFNLILYLMLEKLGIESKNQLIIEYSNLGIQKESIKL